MMVASSVRPSRLAPETLPNDHAPLGVEPLLLYFEILINGADPGITDFRHVSSQALGMRLHDLEEDGDVGDGMRKRVEFRPSATVADLDEGSLECQSC